MVIPVRAVIIMAGALIILASTAVCPNTIVPIILTACPTVAGILVATSRKISNIKSVKNNDNDVGTETSCLEEEMLHSMGVGNISCI